MTARTPSVVIVGAGMSGLLMGIRLKQAGIRSFTIYEKARDVGGTWRDNTYPGLVCDVPSRYYAYSFEPNPGWSRLMSPGPEIHRYFSRVADKHGLRDHIRFGAEVASASHDGSAWTVRTKAGEEVAADFLISCCGVLHHPVVPAIDGIDTFAGAMFHSARWDHSVPLRGRRVGIIGTGSTGVQITTALAGVAGRLDLYQRTAQWVYPTPNLRYRGVGAALMYRFPALNGLSYRVWKTYVERSLGRAVVAPGWQRTVMGLACRLNLMTVRDRELRRRLTPRYDPMCKRIVVSGGFYRAVQKPGVDVVTEAIERIEPQGVRTADGVLHELDVLVLATGFDAHAYLRPIELTNAEGLTLQDAWRDRIQAYRTVALAGFPNFFMLMGPHSPIGNQSLVTIAEDQAEYVMHWIRRFRAGEIRTVAPTPEATERFNAEMRAAMAGTVWMTGCRSWYLGKDGYPELWPWVPERHSEMLREPVAGELEVA